MHNGFIDSLYFLSNFYPCKVGRFSCSEAAFMAQKDLLRADEFVGLTGKQAKSLGRRVNLRSDWDTVRISIMEEVLRCKFSDTSLMKKLHNITGDIVEYNTWNDTFWGVSAGKGENNLGKLLMKIRDESLINNKEECMSNQILFEKIGTLSCTEKEELIAFVEKELFIKQSTYSTYYGICDYTYSGSTQRAREFPKYISNLARKLEKLEKLESGYFNMVLINKYNPNKGLGRHRDDEPEIAPMSTIASVSLGSTRIFSITKGYRTPYLEIPLHDGDIVMMRGRSQIDYYHAVIPAKGLRYNLTFRHTTDKSLNNKGGYMYTPENITSLKDNEIFVFGSNTEGRHGKGAAKQAMTFGAVYSNPEGIQGNTYAVVTKDLTTRSLYPLELIAQGVNKLYKYAEEHTDKVFLITKLGCGLGGHSIQDIGGIFKSITTPDNVVLPIEFVSKSFTYAGIGSRSTPDNILNLMSRVAVRLEELGYTLLSGGAEGADKAFASDVSKKEVYIPWEGFNNINNGIVKNSLEANSIASKYHPVWDRLSQGAKKLMARNMHQILGEDLKTPVDFVLCWTPDGAETSTSSRTGGTGQAIRLAIDKGIPVFNMANKDSLTRLATLLGDS